MSLPLLHAGRTNPGLSAALDLRFALDKSLTAYRGPTPSFSRASTGSYFDGSGVLRYQGYNLCQYSEDFTNAFWTKSLTSASSNVAIAPNGQQTADKIIESASAGFHSVSNTTFNLAASSTASVYLKAGERGFASVEIVDNFRAVINLSDGTVVSNTLASSTITTENAGNGWWRVKYTTNSSNLGRVIIYPLPTSTFGSYTGDGTSGIFAWGVQVETGATANQYSQTTNSANSGPRFNHTYNGTSWVSRGLLVEEQRTNSSPYSVTFNSGNAPWGVADLSISLNSATAPDGTNTATKIIEGTGTGNHNIYRVFPFSGTITWSIFAKAAERNYIQIFIGNLNSPETGINVDLTNGAITNQSPSVVASGTQDVGNGWYRIWFSVTGSGGTYYPAVGTSNSATGIRSSYTGNGTSGVYIWGAQWESGSFPTSYIGNSGNGSTTRSADVCQITGGDFSGFYNANEGSVCFEGDSNGSTASNDNYFLICSDGSTFNNAAPFVFSSGSLNSLRHRVRAGAVDIFNITTSEQLARSTQIKLAQGYKSGDSVILANGSIIDSRTNSFSTSGISTFYIGHAHSGLAQINGHIARLRYYRKRLPNATLQLLSEPDPTLNLQFALNKSLTPVAGPAPSFSRASTGTYFNASGVLTSASINTPRFDHAFSGGQWVSKGLLLEEQRTNLLPRSEEFNTGWTNNDINISTNSVTAPDGTLTADNLVPNTVNTNHRLYQGPAGSGVASVSIFAKSTGYNWLQVRVGAGGGTSVTVNFDIVNGAIGDTVLAGGATASGQSIENVGNGWWRCKFTTASVPAFTTVIMPRPDNASAEGQAYAGDGVKGVAVWGAQLENASFPTSYIGTTSSSVTRSADVCQITGTSFNWMWNQGEGSFSFEADALNPNSVASGQTVYSFDDGSSANSIYGLRSGNTAGSDYLVLSYTSGVEKVNFSNPAGTWLVNVPFKNAIGFKLNDFAQSNNGGSVVTDTNCTMPIGVNQLSIGRLSYAGFPINGHIAKLIYYPARLTNTKLQQLST